MRNRITKEKNTTVFAFVRDAKLYPLAKYLDYADLVLTRKQKNLKTFTEALSDTDPVIRYWSVIGLLLLEKQAKPAISDLKKVLGDQDEIPPFVSWAIYKSGDNSFAKKWMLQTLNATPENNTLIS